MSSNDGPVDCAVPGFAEDDGTGGVFHTVVIFLPVFFLKLGVLPRRNSVRKTVQSVDQAGSRLPTATGLRFALWSGQGG